MSRIWNVAVIGCGIGRSHIAEGYARLPDRFRVVALCDLDRERLDAVGTELGIERRTTALAEVLEMDDVDIVDVCTPPTVHFQQVVDALEAGRHVVCEKPLVGSLAEIDRIIEIEKRSAGRVMPVFQYRYGNGIGKARRLIEAGLAGKPYMATAETAWRRTSAYYEVPWRGRRATELGGALVTHAIHLHDMLTWLMGSAASVFAQTATRVNPIEVEDCAVASVRLESGALASLAATLGAAGPEISRLRLYYEHYTFESNHSPYRPGDDPWQILPDSPAAEAAMTDALSDWHDIPSRFHGLFADYHRALTADDAPPVTLDDARRALELITALYHAAETGLPVALPIGRGHPKYGSWHPSAPGTAAGRHVVQTAGQAS